MEGPTAGSEVQAFFCPHPSRLPLPGHSYLAASILPHVHTFPMRAALILSLLIAILAVVFALQNAGFTDLRLGPYDFRASTALIVILSFGLGTIVGILASLPSRIRSRRRAKALEQQLAQERVHVEEERKLGTPPPTTEPGNLPPPEERDRL